VCLFVCFLYYKTFFVLFKIMFQMNNNLPQKDIVGTVIQKFPQKQSAVRTAKGPISISECDINGEFIILENTSKKLDVNMSNWNLNHFIGSVRKISYKFPQGFALKSKQTVKIWSKDKGIDYQDEDLVVYEIDNWTHGSQDMIIRLENEYGEEKACFRKTS
jgi:intermediate filament protein if